MKYFMKPQDDLKSHLIVVDKIRDFLMEKNV